MKRGDRVVILTDEFEYGELKQGAIGVIDALNDGLYWVKVGDQQMPLYASEIDLADD